MQNDNGTLNYSKEEEFIADYLRVKDKHLQIDMILKYRKWVAQLNRSNAGVLKILADSLYSDRSQRFFLELLQNADDNKYAKGVEPLVEFELDGNTLTIRNNEKGFSADDIYSITTAALSTKYLTDDSAYIGEKGIGFKSVFAVADKVEIHSNGYHFYLLNNEYIFPHWIDKLYQQQQTTEIILHLKKEPHLLTIIEEHFKGLSHQTLGMILFLSKLRRIRITTPSLGTEDIRIEDRGKYRKVYSKENLEGSYYIYRYISRVGIEEIQSRYPKLTEGMGVDHLNREIIFAVPDPELMSISNFKGYYFAFLQTHMQTGLPLHIQIDAQTISNREQYSPMIDSPWNAKMMEGLADELSKLYQMLASEKNYVDHLPLFLPLKEKPPINANDDVTLIHKQLGQHLKNLPIFSNNSGKLCRNNEVVMLPSEGSDFCYAESKYEKYIGDCYEDVKPPSKMYFVRSSWNKSCRSVLWEYGVSELEYIDYFILLRAGPPQTVNIKDYLQVTEFNSFLMRMLRKISSFDHLDENQQEYIKSAKVFPVRLKSSERTWMPGNGAKELRWQNVKSKTARDPSKSFLYVDAEFTFTPGGSTNNREQISKINQEYREFLGYIGLRQQTAISLLIDNHVNILRGSRNLSPIEAERHWIGLYDGYWKNRKTLENVNRAAFIELTELLPDCRIPVLHPLHDPKHELVMVKESFIGNHFHAQETELYGIYRGLELPIIHMSSFTAKAKINWKDYTDFFIEIKAHNGAFLEETDLRRNRWIVLHDKRIRTDDKSRQILDPFLRAIAEAVRANSSYRETYDYFDIQSSHGGRHYSLDRYSHILLRSDLAVKSDYLARRISKTLFDALKSPISIYASWKHNPGSSQITAENRYFETYIAPFLYLREAVTGNLVKASQPLFFYNKSNRELLGNLGAYVKDSEYGGNVLFLEACEVKRDVDAKDVQILLESSAQRMIDQPTDDNVRDYIEHLQFLCRYLRSSATDKSQLTKTLKLANPTDLILQMPHRWLEDADISIFGKQLIDDLRKLLQDRDDMDMGELFISLCMLEHKTDGHLLKLLDAIGSKLRDSEEAISRALSIALVSATQDSGIFINGKRIYNSQALPTIWFAYLGFDTDDADEIGVWPLPPETLTENLKTVLSVLSWPTSEKLPCSAESFSSLELSMYDYQKLDKCYRTAHKDIDEVLNPLRAEVLSMIKNRSIVIHEGLHFSVGVRKMPVSYAIWDRLYLSDNISPLFVLLSDMGGLDPKLMSQIWQSKDFFSDDESKQESSDSSEDKTHTGEEKRHHSQGGQASGSGSRANEDESASNHNKNGKSKGGKSDSANRSGPHVFYRSGIYSGNPGGSDKGRQETAKKGEQIVIDYESKEGRVAVSQRINNPGYDLVSENEAEKRFIEIKTVNGHWTWVLLSKTEYEASRSLGDEYWIYVVELYEDGSHEITTVNDPYNKVNYYSLDDGWKDFENEKYRSGQPD